MAARFETRELPIYKEMYDLYLYIANVIKDMRADIRISLGNKIHEDCAKTIVTINKAKNTKNLAIKIGYVNEIIENISILEISLRICKDMKQISIDGFAKIVEKSENVLKQATGWHKYLAKTHRV